MTCVAGRDLVSGSCVCTGSNDLRVFIDDLRCSKETTAVLDAVLSNDFLTLNIDFGTAIQADSSLSSSSGAICGYLFDASSMLKISTDSNCAISGSSVVVSLGKITNNVKFVLFMSFYKLISLPCSHSLWRFFRDEPKYHCVHL